MGVSTVKLNGTTLMTVNDTTSVAADVAQGKYFYAADGTKTAGTASGGGGGGATKKQVNFIDYDGTLLYSYTAQEANALSALPANPSHTGLTAQGWNWTLAQIKAHLTAAPDGDVWVGQMYITQSGNTEIDVSMPEGRLSPIMTIAVNGTITVDWGDNTTPDTVTGTSLTTQQAVPHTYASPGDYTIAISVTSGSFSFYGSSAYLILRKNSTTDQNRVYANCVQNIRLGSGIAAIGSYAFYHCDSLASITIPDSVTSIGGRAFYYCYSLASITIPDSVTSISTYAFCGCYSLASIAIPDSVTSIEAQAFYYCYSLSSITIPNSITSINTYAFSSCYSLAIITIPTGVTSIGSSAFTNGYSLAIITIPTGVTSIGSYAFSTCCGVAEYHFLPTTPPTLNNTNAFSGIPSDCVMYVPYSADHSVLNTYKTASNWSDYASYMQEEPQ